MDPNANTGADQLIGQTIGNYLVTQKLGEGGMGSVYLAEHPTIGKKVALKVLHSEFASNQEVASRFFNEAKAVNDIGHPNIVDIVDFGILQGVVGREQLVYFIMEYLHGTSVTSLIRNEAPLPPERALGLALQVADALAASHKCGIVHRDLKPDNIILVTRARQSDFVKLLDFGIAKLTGDHAGGNRTRTGIVMGTPAYMSPEQCDGKGLVDHRTDIYALGILLYEMLTGRVPFVGEGYGEVLVQHLTQKPLPPSQFRMLPPHVEIVVLKALEKRQDMRYPTMEEFMRAMSDPVGYVEANGGLQGFLGRQLMPSTAPIQLPPLRSPMSSPNLTPPPGTLSPVPGSAAPTFGGSPPSVIGAPAPAGRSSRMGFAIAGVVVIAAAVAGIVVVAGGRGSGSGGTNAALGGSGSAAVTTPGSAAVATPGSAVGSSGGAVTIPRDTVDIALTSTPAGAEVWLDGADQNMKTPCTLHLKHGDASMVSFKLDGYVETSREVHLDRDSKEDVALEAKPAAQGSAGSATTPATGSATTPTAGSAATPMTGSGSAVVTHVLPPNTGHTTPVTPPNTGHTTPIAPPNTGHVTPPNTGHTHPPPTGHQGSAAHHDTDGTIKPGDI